MGDPESDAVRDHREVTILLRAEVNALTALLIAKGVFSLEQIDAQLRNEAELLSRQYEERFPGFKATDAGLQLDARAVETMKGWKP